MKNDIPWQSLHLLNSTLPCGVPGLLETARAVKKSTLDGDPVRPLRDKHIVLLCEVDDSIQVAAFESAGAVLGGQVRRVRPSLFRPTGPPPGDVPYNAIGCIGMVPGDINDIARNVSVPLLWDWEHAADAIAGLMTLLEHQRQPLGELKLCLLGDLRSATGDAWLQVAATSGIELRMVAPRHSWPGPNRMRSAICRAFHSGALLRLLDCRAQAEDGADFIYDLRVFQGDQGRSGLSIAESGVSPALALAGEHVQNRRYALQAMLCSSVGGVVEKLIH